MSPGTDTTNYDHVGGTCTFTATASTRPRWTKAECKEWIVDAARGYVHLKWYQPRRYLLERIRYFSDILSEYENTHPPTKK